MISTTLHLEHTDLPLTRVIRSVPDADIRVVPDASTDPDHATHYFQIAAPDFSEIETCLGDDHTVETFSMISETVDGRIYLIEYSDRVVLVSPTVVEVQGLVLESRSRKGGWELRLQLAGYDSLYELRDYIEEHGFEYGITEISQATESGLQSENDLTEPQIEALVCAYRDGYFDKPREASLEDLSSVLGVSQAAVSGRLKRGIERIIEKTLIENDDK